MRCTLSPFARPFRYVPREWMLHEAYSAAERGDNSVVDDMQRIFADPFAEHSGTCVCLSVCMRA